MSTNDVHLDFEDNLEEDFSPLHQICPKAGQTLRIAMLDAFCKPMACNYHWYRNGFYRCNTPKDGPEARCCEVKQSWTCVSLALVYQNADANGKIAQGGDIKYRVGYVSLSKTAYLQVHACHKKAAGCDLLYSNDGGYGIREASCLPAWRQSPQSAEVEAAARKWADGKKLIEKLGKKLTDAEWVRLMKTGSTVELEDWE
jgi:hypothetical protein